MLNPLLTITEEAWNSKNIEENFRRIQDFLTEVESRLNLEETEGTNIEIGELGLFEGVASQTGIGTSFVKINQFDDSKGANIIIVDVPNDQFVLTNPGLYSIEGYFSFTGSNNVTFTLTPHFQVPGIVGVIPASRQMVHKIGAGDVQTITYTTMLGVLVGGTIMDFRIKADAGSNTFALQEASINVINQALVAPTPAEGFASTVVIGSL